MFVVTNVQNMNEPCDPNVYYKNDYKNSGDNPWDFRIRYIYNPTKKSYCGNCVEYRLL